ncbi:MAG: UDP-N-acetylmuramate dehydrogenase [Firmicutes bacterium]|nr:UDP-N-acetylmuramate dehydrogenase [Bacillota bacterium]
MELVRALGVAYEENVPMSAKTSFKIGGPAELMLFPATPGQLSDCLKLCAEQGVKPFILGNGSNLLVKDSGIDGVVISTEKLQKMTYMGDGLIYCEAGVRLGELCVFAQKQGLAGLEFAYGIPGSAGGAVYMNAGAYGGEMKDILHSAQYIDASGELRELPAGELELDYRSSVFMRNNGVVAGLTVKLRPGDPAEIRAKMNETMQKRKDKQPLELPSAGSVFKRPEGRFAGALIEQCGLKGQSVGGARVSEKHAGFIVNAGGASAADVRALIALVQTVVEAETGVFLEPEIRFV